MKNIIKGLFGRKPPEAPARDVRELARPLAVPAAHILTQTEPTRSHFGGNPQLPASLPWPCRDSKPLTFLARLSLSELSAAQSIDWLPDHGALLFFYDFNTYPWGFDPKDRGGWAVIHTPDVDSRTPQSSADEPQPNAPPYRPIGFRAIQVFPSLERNVAGALKLTHSELDTYYKISDEPFGSLPRHQVSGRPYPIQGDDMELECQLVSQGLYCGNSSGYQDPRAESLRAGSAQWRLLFQFDSDEELNVMWGDAGMLYFWIREEDARAGRFENAWLVCQCH